MNGIKRALLALVVVAALFGLLNAACRHQSSEPVVYPAAWGYGLPEGSNTIGQVTVTAILDSPYLIFDTVNLIAETLTVTGTAQANTLEATDAVTVGGTLNVAAKATFSDDVLIDAGADVVPLTVQAYQTPTGQSLIVEAYDGTDVFTVDEAGALVVASTADLQGNLSDSGGTLTIADDVMIDGASDAVQLTVQGHSTQTTSNLFVVENSDATDQFAVDVDGNVDVAGAITVTGVGTFSSALSANTLESTDAITCGAALGVAGASSLSGNVTLGDAIGDNIYVYGQMRSYDGSDNWADVADVSALSRGNGWHASYNVTGWGGATDFQALFANTQVTDTSANVTFYGIEGKATLKGVVGTGTTTGIGVMGKVIAKTTSVIPEGYGVYSRLETEGSDAITSGANFMADLGNSGTITTSRVLYTEADTWDNGVDLSAGTFTSDHVLQNGETIDNATDGYVTISAFTAFAEQTAVVVTEGSIITPTGSYQPLTSAAAVTTSATTAIADGGKVGAVLILINENASDAIIIKNGANTHFSADITLGNDDVLACIWDGADWIELYHVDNS